MSGKEKFNLIPLKALQDFMNDLKAAIKREKYKRGECGKENMINHGGSRPMKYAYTYSAKIAQFPLKKYYEKCWFFRYWMISVIVCIPFFAKVQRMSYSPENVAKWREIREREFTPGPHEH